MYDEVSVRKVWLFAKEDAALSFYFPDIYKKDRYPDRDFFFNVLNTLYPDYLKSVIQHANRVRN